MKIEILPQLILQESLIRIANILWQVRKECELGCRRWQLRAELDLYILSFKGRRRLMVDYRKHHLIKLRGSDALGLILIHFHSGFYGLIDTLFGKR